MPDGSGEFDAPVTEGSAAGSTVLDGDGDQVAASGTSETPERTESKADAAAAKPSTQELDDPPVDEK